ncbi:inositol polyphosphate 5-phosphatase [Aphanomyces cochlioides]|nr:inositol polyphosphate 5-phosphatase [Aphanomyces cochlioides]
MSKLSLLNTLHHKLDDGRRSDAVPIAESNKAAAFETTLILQLDQQLKRAFIFVVQLDIARPTCSDRCENSEKHRAPSTKIDTEVLGLYTYAVTSDDHRIEPTSPAGRGDDVVDCEVHIDYSRGGKALLVTWRHVLALAHPNAVASDAQDAASDVRGQLGEYEDSKDDGATRTWPTPLTLQDHIDVSKESTADIAKRGTVRVFVMTWNLQAQKPPEDLGALLRPSAYHVYAIGTEECVRTIAKSVIFQSKKEWEDQLKATLGPEYTKLRSHALTAMHNVVFVHQNVFPLISHLHSDAIATGLGNHLGNKGGVSIAFNIGRTSFAFVGCHFEAHQSQHALQRRNANFHKINTELQLVDPTEDHRHGPITEAFDRVFWCGDLNYRIDGTRRMIDNLLERNFHDVLLVNDQLRKEMLAGRVFQRFREGPLHFRPTYKFDKGSDMYDSSPKQRIPSWTDRILFLSTTPKAIVQRAYESHMEIKTSDHRPVTAIFDVEFMTESTRHDTTALVGSDQTKSEVCCLQ